MRCTVIGTLLVVGIVAARPSAQSQPTPKATFEVASVKMNKTGDELTEDFSFSGTLFTATSMTLRNVIALVYEVRDDQFITGGPGWLATDRFDVVARASTDPGAGRPRYIAMLAMLRSLLADRFGLNTHYETKQVQGFELRLARAGARQKLKVSACVGKPGDPGCGDGIESGGGIMTWRLRAKTIAEFATFLQHGLRRPVTDGTGLSEKYDFDFRFRVSDLPGWGLAGFGPAESFTADDITSDTGSLASVLKESFGLSLNRRRVPATFLVIDSVHQPTEN